MQIISIGERIGSIRFYIEELKSIPFLDQLYLMALNVTEPLLKTNNGNNTYLWPLITIQNGLKQKL